MKNMILPPVCFKVRLRSMDIWIIHEVMYENVYQLPDKMDGLVVCDVGANIGAFAAACVARGAQKVYAFEPHPENFDLLCHNTEGSRKISQHCKALWTKGADSVRFTSHGGYTAAWRCLNEDESAAKEVVVKAVTLDDMLGRRKIDLLKLDCEGGEWPGVYESKKIVNVKQILIETHDSIKVPGFNCTTNAMIKHLKSIGFEVETYKQGAQAKRGQSYLKATNKRAMP